MIESDNICFMMPDEIISLMHYIKNRNDIYFLIDKIYHNKSR